MSNILPRKLGPTPPVVRDAFADGKSRLTYAEEGWLLTCSPRDLQEIHILRICESADSLSVDLVEHVASILEGEADRLEMLAELKKEDPEAPKTAAPSLRYGSKTRRRQAGRLRALLVRMHQRQKELLAHSRQHGGSIKTQLTYWYWRAAKKMLHPDDLEQIRAAGRARMESWLNGGTDRDDGELFEELEGGDHA